MTRMISVGLIGDHDPAVTAHRAIPEALRLAGDALAVTARPTWIPTDEITGPGRVAGFDGLWAVPSTPYRSMEGALRAIRHAREEDVPFLGTCGGFQHAIVEYARNVLGWADADHAETTPGASRAVIGLLSCALVETMQPVLLRAGTRIARAYGSDETMEGYHCRYGLNPLFEQALLSGPLRIGAVDDDGAVRAVELEGHPFFVATLFQPERAALDGRTPPIVAEFLRRCALRAAQTPGAPA